jgi:hypothetical protein
MSWTKRLALSDADPVRTFTRPRVQEHTPVASSYRDVRILFILFLPGDTRGFFWMLSGRCTTAPNPRLTNCFDKRKTIFAYWASLERILN